MATAGKRGNTPSKEHEALGRPDGSSSRQQTHRGQRTQTGSDELDGATADKAPAKVRRSKR